MNVYNEKKSKPFDFRFSYPLADSIVAAADALGKVIAGDFGFGGLMKAILTQFANFLKTSVRNS